MNIVIVFSLIIAILLAGILVITKILSKRIWLPFYDTLKQIQGFEIDKNKTPQFMVTDIEEFAQLHNSLNRLIERNIDIYNTQKEFVENAAHELQTPLSLFQARIDNLSQLDMSKEQSMILSALNDDVSRLNRLNKNLLLLSKIESGSDNYFEKKAVVINDSVKKHLAFFAEQAKSKNLEITTELSEKTTIDCNPELAEVLINNLFLNAIRHNKRDGKISITLSGKSLTFCNNGPENALETQKLFNRFAKSDPSSQGNGLGLAIIKKIAEVNHWDISYSFYENLHRFTIKFQ